MYNEGNVKEKGKMNMRIADILFDTETSHSSYILKDLVDIYRDTRKDNIEKTNSSVILGDNKTVIKIDEVVKLNLGFEYDEGKREQRGEITMCVLDMP